MGAIMKKSLFIFFTILITFTAFSRTEKDKPEAIERKGLRFKPQTYTAQRDSLLYESFEDSLLSEEWTVINSDNNEYEWETTDYYDAHTGNFVAMVSYNSAGNDDWLISPAITLDGDQSFEFWARSTSNNFLEEFSVLISNTGIDTTSFVVLEDFINHSSNWTEHSYDLTEYSGEVHIAFHSTSINEAILIIDDVCIKDLPETPLAALNFNSLDFDEVEVGTHSNPFGDLIELTNVDEAELIITSITDLSGTNFATNFDSGVTLLADSSYAFGFEYSPTSAIEDTIYFEIVTNGGTVGIGLKGTGYELEANVVQIGTDNYVNSHLPIDPLYNYSYSQTLYLQEELQSDFDIIKSISYRYSGSEYNDTIMIYAGFTEQDSLSNWINIDNLSQIFAGSIEAEAEANWIEIILDQPIFYDGYSNLILAVIDLDEGHLTDSDDFLASETDHTMSLTFNSDTEYPSPVNPQEAELLNYTPNTRFRFINMPEFNPVSNIEIDELSAYMTWDAPDLDPNSTLLGYKIFHYDEEILFVENNYCSLEGLIPSGFEILIGVQAIYILGESEIITVEFEWSTPYGDEGTVPMVTSLQGNYPNPFNPKTTINFSLKEAGNVTLEIYNLKGQKVKTLLNDNMEAANHSVIWNGDDNKGNKVSSGIYMYRMKTKDYSKTQKMILMK